jgi:hypothetical protein
VDIDNFLNVSCIKSEAGHTSRKRASESYTISCQCGYPLCVPVALLVRVTGTLSSWAERHWFNFYFIWNASYSFVSSYVYHMVIPQRAINFDPKLKRMRVCSADNLHWLMTQGKKMSTGKYGRTFKEYVFFVFFTLSGALEAFLQLYHAPYHL